MTDIGNSYTQLARSSSDLCAFMLVCQHGKLAAAAQAMHLSQPSLSQRIKNLETTLGKQLFLRHSSGVDLTHDGQELLRVLGQPLHQAATRFQEYRADTRARRVVISVDHAFGALWLLPRLPQLREESGSTDICIVSSQDPRSNTTSHSDIRIFMARSTEVPPGSKCLLQEQVSAVCSPSFLKEHSDIRKPEDLLRNQSRLVHLASPAAISTWLDWPQWLQLQKVVVNQLPAKIVFNSYEMIISAARRDQGVALGWHGLIDDLLASSELVALFPDAVKTETGYYIDTSDTNALSSTLRIRDWILEQALSPA